MTFLKSLTYQLIQLSRGSFFVLRHPANRGKLLSTLWKMIYWKANKHFFKNNLIAEIDKGVFCICPFWSSYGGVIYMTKNPEYGETMFYMQAVRKNSIIIDIGSNIGYYSLLGAVRVSNGKIYAFDVDKRVNSILLENVKLNTVKSRVVNVESLASDRNGKEGFIEEHEAEMNHIAYSKTSKNHKFPAVTIDRFLSGNKIKHLRIVKIDVEGAEYKVLLGMKKSLKRHDVDYLIIELNENIIKFGFSHKTMLNYLHKLSYNVYLFEINGVRALTGVNVGLNDLNKNILAVSPKVKQEFRKNYLV